MKSRRVVDSLMSRLPCLTVVTQLANDVARTLCAVRRRLSRPPVGWVRIGSLRRLSPVSRQFGFDRGQPIDRYYIEHFLACYADDIEGYVLEVADNSYTRAFGGERVNQSDVLDVAKDNPQATIIADLACGESIPSDTFDCIILTQTLHLIYDVRAAIQTIYRILRPGGILLATFPGISQSTTDDRAAAGSWYWGFTAHSADRLFKETFAPEKVWVEAYGNVLAAVAFLHGLAAEELRHKELDYRDPRYDLLVTVRAEK
jgi:SAM-dependent methyltransferase